MSERKLPGTDDPLARLTPIEATEFLDRLVLERALPLLQASCAETPKAEPRVAPTPVEALLGSLPRLKSSG